MRLRKKEGNLHRCTESCDRGGNPPRTTRRHFEEKLNPQAQINIKRRSSIKVQLQKHTHLTREKSRKCSGILGNIADSIICGFCIKKEERLFLKNPKPYCKSTTEEWKEKESDLNLLQLAILYGRADIVEILQNKYNFRYNKTLFVVKCVITNTATREKKDVEKLFYHNTPLHLACKMGNLRIIQLLLSKKYTKSNEIQSVLEERSILRLDKVSEAHKNLFTRKNEEKSHQLFQEMDENSIAVNFAKVGIEYRSKTQFSDKYDTSKFLSSLSSLKSAIEICAEEGHLHCCTYLADLMYRHSYRLHTRKKLNKLHKACYLQVPGYLELLLKEDDYKQDMNTADTSGIHPLLMALHNRECVHILLQHGADPKNVRYKNKSLLQWLITDYTDLDQWNVADDGEGIGRRITCGIFETARLLLKSGVDVNYQEQQSSCSNYCYYSNKRSDQMVYKPRTVLEEILDYYVKTENILEKESYLYDFISLLFEFGAKTVLENEYGICERCASKSSKMQAQLRKQRRNLLNNVDRTVGNTFLDTVGTYYDYDVIYNRENSKCMLRVMKLLLEEGALDVNVVPINQCNVLQLFMGEILEELEPKVQRSILHLLFINGADFNSMPKPNTTSKNHPIRSEYGFKIFPLVEAFDKCFEFEVLVNIIDFMSNSAIQQSFSQLEIYYNTRDEKDLKHLIEQYSVRTLSHLCKLVVISFVGKQGRVKIQSLFIPDILKMYLCCNVF